jgi:hypothetical protein
LNGREKKDGATLYIVSAASGQVEHSLAVEATADQNPPRVNGFSGTKPADELGDTVDGPQHDAFQGHAGFAGSFHWTWRFRTKSWPGARLSILPEMVITWPCE